MERRVWRWEEKIIKKVKKFKYLGYVIQRNGEQEAQIRDKVKRAAAIMEGVWGIGKRRFGKDWGRRIWLFDRIFDVDSVGVRGGDMRLAGEGKNEKFS